MKTKHLIHPEWLAITLTRFCNWIEIGFKIHIYPNGSYEGEKKNMTLKIKPDIYPMAYPLEETIGICDTGNINDPEEFQILISILNHEYLHILLYKLEGDEPNIALDNLPINIEGSS